MPRNSNPERDKKKKLRGPIKQREETKRGRKKPCIFCKEKIDYIDYKDSDLLRRFVSDRGKIRGRRVNGNCVQHQRDVANAIKTSREMALMPYALRLVTARGAGRSSRSDDDGEERLRGPRDRDDRGPKAPVAVAAPVIEAAVVAVEDVAVTPIPVEGLEISGDEAAE